MEAETKTRGKTRKKMTKRPGLSLVLVVVVAIAGMALLGVSFLLFENFTHRSFRTMGGIEEINAMDEGIERGRLALQELIDDSTNMPQAVFKNSASGQITSSDDLKVAESDGSTDPWETDAIQINTAAGETVTLTIELFDVMYEEGDLDATVTANTADARALRATLPPAMDLAAATLGDIDTAASGVGEAGISTSNTIEEQDNSGGFNRTVISSEAGIYMIRATVTRPDGHGRITEVVQAIKKD